MSANKKHNISSKVEIISPKLARVILSKNNNNRNLSQRTVNYYKNMIEKVLWQTNGESIKIATAGTLLDGQHRLDAISKSGIPVTTLVVRGLDKKTFKTIDSGRVRTHAEFLKIDGKNGPNLNILAAAARIAMGFDKQTGKYNHVGRKVSPSKILNFVDKYSGIEHSASIQERLRKFCSPSIAAGVHYIFSVVDPTAADKFFDFLYSGNDLNEGNPVLTLRNRFITVRESGRAGAAHQRMIVCYFVSAFNAYREGKKMQNLTYSPEREIVLDDFAGAMKWIIVKEEIAVPIIKKGKKEWTTLQQ